MEPDQIAVMHADARTVLRTLTVDQLQRGLRAFDHPPRNKSYPYGEDRAGCFVYEVTGKAYSYTPAYGPLSISYESHNDWFKGEVLRELAERGVVQEPSFTQEAT